MKKLNYLLLLGLLIGFVSLTGCKKDDDKPNAKEEKIKNLSRTWKVTDAMAGTQNVKPSSDVLLTFNGSKTYSITNVSGLPNNNDKIAASGTWDLSSDLSKVILNGSTELTIITATPSNFDFSYMVAYPKPTSTPETQVTVKSQAQ